MAGQVRQKRGVLYYRPLSLETRRGILICRRKLILYEEKRRSFKKERGIMIQQQKFRLPLVGVIVLGLLVGLGAALAMAARKQGAKEESADGVARHSVNTSAADTLKYWTEERMQSAKPAKMPKAKKLKPLEDGKKRKKRPRA